MQLKIETLTPLWTGGVEAGNVDRIKVDRIHETGILGSLRWWYEAIVRGMGRKACDPSTGKCKFDLDSYRRSSVADERQRLRDSGLCDVCQVFGATGWRRRFRLTIADKTNPDTSSPKRISADRPSNPKTDKKPTWWFHDYPRVGNLSIQIQSLTPEFPAAVIAGLIQFIADWAAIGARPQMGFGVIKPQKERFDTRPLYELVVPIADKNTYPDLPSLQNIFLARISPKNNVQFSERETFNLKWDLRQLFQNDYHLRHFIMGTVKDQRIAAKVRMSRPYDNGRLMRVWGWIPEKANVYQSAWNRDSVIAEIYKHLNKNYALQKWREMNSSRDNVTPNIIEARSYLQSLLGLKEEVDAT